jgi:hypothetical protein
MNDTWEHNCPIEGTQTIGKGECCKWCDAEEPVVDEELQEKLRKLREMDPFIYD